MMTRIKKYAVLMLSLIIILTQIVVMPVSAATSSNISSSTNKTSVECGDTFTVTLHCKSMKVAAFMGGIKFNKSVVSVDSISGCRTGREGAYLKKSNGDYVDLLAELNDQKNAVGFVYYNANEQQFDAQDFLKITFKGIKAGNPDISLYEKSDGTKGVIMDSIIPEWSVSIVNEDGSSNPEPGMHVHAVADKTDVKAGEKFYIIISTDAMRVSTFIAGIKYDNNLMSYNGCTGFRSGVNGTYLKKTTGDYVDVTVEEGENGNSVGFYMTNAGNVYYAAGNLVKLEFQAKKPGTIQPTLFEDSAGYDGFKKNDVSSGITINVTEAGSVNPAAKLHVHATASKDSVKVGDTVSITIKTDAMNVSTFTAGLEFDNSLLEYTGFSGFRTSMNGAFLKKNNGDYVTVNVEKGESGDSIGLYMTGATDVQFESGNLVKLNFKAIKQGTVSPTIYEDTAGYDRYQAKDVPSGIKITIKKKQTNFLLALIDRILTFIGDLFHINIRTSSAEMPSMIGGLKYNPDVVELVDINGKGLANVDIDLTNQQGEHFVAKAEVDNKAGDLHLMIPENVGKVDEQDLMDLTFRVKNEGNPGFKLYEKEDNSEVIKEDDIVTDLEIVDENIVLAEQTKTQKVKSLKLSAKKNGSIKLNWNKIKGISVDYYVIYRSTKKNSGFKKIATVKGSKKSYTNSKKLKKGRRYYYKVKAYKKIAGKKVYTQFSAIKSIKCKKTR